LASDAPQDEGRIGGVRVEAAGTTVHVTAHGTSMAELAKNLSGFRSIARPVNDFTALTGRFDFELAFAAAVAPGGEFEFSARRRFPG
jgi:uncharacterized protein (TIGR03435 family)